MIRSGIASKILVALVVAVIVYLIVGVLLLHPGIAFVLALIAFLLCLVL